MAKSHKGSKRGPKKGSKRGSKKGSKRGPKKGSKRGSKKSKKCPPGTRKSFKKLASGRLSKRSICLPWGKKTTSAASAGSKYEEGEPGAYDDTLDFNLPALGFRVKRRGSRRGSRKTHRRRHSRKY